MFACSRCHVAVECKAGRHQLTYFGVCEVCGHETTIFDCVGGEVIAKHRLRPPGCGISAYLHTGRVEYPRKRR